MAALTVNQVNLDGKVATLATPTASTGDTFVNNGNTLLIVDNGSGAPITVTVNSTAAAGSGKDDDAGGSVAAGAVAYFGPFPTDRFGTNPTVICSAVTTVTAGALKLR